MYNIPYPTVEVKHIWQVYVTSELIIKLFFFFTIHPMIWIFIAVRNKCLNLFEKIHKELKWTKKNRNEVMQPTTSTNDSRPIFPYHVHNQADFDNPFINGRGFIYLRISKISFTCSVFTGVQVSESIKAARKANIWRHAHYCR